MGLSCGCALVESGAELDVVTSASGAWSQEALATSALAEEAGQEDLAEWWRLLGDAELSDLVERALQQSPTLEETRLRIVIARARRGVEAAGRRPSVDGFASIERAETGDDGLALGGAPPGVEVDIYSLGLLADWEFDLWGRAGNLVAAADAEVEVSIEDLRAARVALISEVATELVTLRAQRMDLEVVLGFIESERESLDVMEGRLRGGVSRELDVEQARLALASTRALRPALEAAERSSELRLAVLVGEPPQAFRCEGSGLPTRYPLPALGVPAELALRRPDIRRDLKGLAAARSRASATRAERFPSVSFSGSFALQGDEVGAMTNPDASILTLGRSISLPLFDRRRIQARIDEAESEEQMALLALQDTVLNAVADVERAAVGRAKAASQAALLREAVEAAATSEDLARIRYEAGLGDYLDVVDARRARLELERDGVNATRDELHALIDLYAALGGGWKLDPDR